MPRLVKGAKWTFGWVVVGPGGGLPIPPDAWREYGFQGGDEAVLLQGSRRSGGFALSTPRLISKASKRMGGGSLRQIGCGRMGEGWLTLPPGASVELGDMLLTVRGSCYGLGFVAQGPIYQQALHYTGVLSVLERTGAGQFIWRVQSDCEE